MTSQSFRRPTGGRIDRTKPISFTFDGTDYAAFPGDSLASALLANGQHMVARSFKYHRPRGIVAAGSEDPAAIVQIGDEPTNRDPNVRVTEQEVFDGLRANSQNCWPSLKFDIGILNDVLSPFLPSGFYYKTFMGPKALGWPNWMTFEPIIRASAGLGIAPEGPDPDTYESINRHCDVLVVGGGPAGLAAALAAGRSGARVMLVEETSELGGTLLSRDPTSASIDGKPPAEWVADVRRALADLPEVTILTRTVAFGYYANNFVGLWEKISDHLPPGERDTNLPRQRVWRIRAKQVVLATGALERPLVFHENDRPGIMLAGAMRSFIHRYGVFPGQRVVVATNNDTGWEAAFDMAQSGMAIDAIVDLRADVSPDHLSAAARRGIPIHANSTIVATHGRARVKAVDIRTMSDENAKPVRVACDCIGMAGGWAPNVALFSQSRGKLRYDDHLAAFRPGRPWQKQISVGAANGQFALSDCVAEGVHAGVEAASAAGFDSGDVSMPAIERGDEGQGNVLIVPELPTNLPSGKVRAFIDLQDDVTTKDLRLARQEGFQPVEHAKRYTTTGMGTDQGKIANLNAFAFLAKEAGEPVPAIGTTTFRQPYKPVTFAAIAGQHVGKNFAPRRTTPMHAWHCDQNTIFEPVGDWIRARAYLREGETFDDAVQRESLAARQSIGVLDASTLGKVDVRGPDAREFLNRVYTNAWLKLQPGKCRYGLMLGEDGMVSDDGVTACLADDHFHMTTTTGGAAAVMGRLEDYLQTEWPDLDVYLTSTTEQWAVASVCGPKSDQLMAELCDDLDPDPKGFEFMSWRDARIGGIPVRIFRISFTGELSYEINIPARFGLWLWELIMERGARFDITPYGTEAMHLLRAEKGFIIVGQETDGTITPHDLRMDWIVKKSADFIGRRSLTRPNTARTDRKQLVGLLTEDPNVVLKEGAQLIEKDAQSAVPVPMLGHVTSSYFSPNLNRSIALAVLKNGGNRMGDVVSVARADGDPIPAIVSETDFMAIRDAKFSGGDHA